VDVKIIPNGIGPDVHIRGMRASRKIRFLKAAPHRKNFKDFGFLGFDEELIAGRHEMKGTECPSPYCVYAGLNFP
jgi:hypothetical protein